MKRISWTLIGVFISTLFTLLGFLYPILMSVLANVHFPEASTHFSTVSTWFRLVIDFDWILGFPFYFAVIYILILFNGFIGFGFYAFLAISLVIAISAVTAGPGQLVAWLRSTQVALMPLSTYMVAAAICAFRYVFELTHRVGHLPDLPMAIHGCCALAVLFVVFLFKAARYALKDGNVFAPFIFLILALESVHAFFTSVFVYMCLKT